MICVLQHAVAFVVREVGDDEAVAEVVPVVVVEVAVVVIVDFVADPGPVAEAVLLVLAKQFQSGGRFR